MKKKILIGIGIFVVILAVAFAYLNNRNRTLSPPGHTELESNGLKVAIDYSRPSVRDRLIFGSEEAGALQPHTVYWRLGANEPTFIKVNKDFNFEGTAMKAGKYAMYAIPNEEGFEIRLNSDLRFWGYTEPDYSLDVLKTNVIATKSDSVIEQFTIEMAAKNDGIAVIFSWSDRVWEVMIASQ